MKRKKYSVKGYPWGGYVDPFLDNNPDSMQGMEGLGPLENWSPFNPDWMQNAPVQGVIQNAPVQGVGVGSIVNAALGKLGQYAGAIQSVANPKVNPKEDDYKFNWAKAVTAGGILTELAKKISMDNARSKHVMGASPGNYSRGGVISKAKAREILHDGTVHGNPITEKQRRFFGAMISRKALGGFMGPDPGGPKFPGGPVVTTPYNTNPESTATRYAASKSLGNPAYEFSMVNPIKDIENYDFVMEKQLPGDRPLTKNQPVSNRMQKYHDAMALRKTDYNQYVVQHYNPLNLMYNGPESFTAKYGALPGRINTHGTLAAFPDMETGLRAAREKLLTELYRNKTLDEAMKTWSGYYVEPKSGERRSGYGADLIAPKLATKLMKELTPEELNAVVKKMAQWEDGRTYRVIDWNTIWSKIPGAVPAKVPGKAMGGELGKMLGLPLDPSVGLNMLSQPQTVQSLLKGMPNMPLKMGGVMNYASGGDMKLSDNSFLVNGNPSVTDGNFYPQLNARLDHGEVVKDNFVFSNKLRDPQTNVTYAKLAQPVEKSTGKAEKFMKRFQNDVFSKNTVMQNNKFLDSLSNKQEMLATAMGLRQNEQPMGYAAGGKMEKDPDPNYLMLVKDNIYYNPYKGGFFVRGADGSYTASNYKFGDEWLAQNAKNIVDFKRQYPELKNVKPVPKYAPNYVPVKDNIYYDKERDGFFMKTADGSYIAVNYREGDKWKAANAKKLNEKPAVSDDQWDVYDPFNLEESLQPQSVGPVPAAPTPKPPSSKGATKSSNKGAKAKTTQPALDPYEQYLQENPIPLPQGVQTSDEAFYDYLKANGLWDNYMQQTNIKPTATDPTTFGTPLTPVGSDLTTSQTPAAEQQLGQKQRSDQKWTTGDYLNAAAVLGKFAQLLGGPEEEQPVYDATRITRQVYDPMPALYQSDRQTAGMLNRMDVPSINARTSIANNMLAQRLNQDAQTLSSYQNMNAQALKDYETRTAEQRRYNAAQTLATNQINAQNRAAYKQAWDNAMTSLGGFGTAMNQKTQAYDTLNILKVIYPKVYQRIIDAMNGVAPDTPVDTSTTGTGTTTTAPTAGSTNASGGATSAPVTTAPSAPTNSTSPVNAPATPTSPSPPQVPVPTTPPTGWMDQYNTDNWLANIDQNTIDNWLVNTEDVSDPTLLFDNGQVPVGSALTLDEYFTNKYGNKNVPVQYRDIIYIGNAKNGEGEVYWDRKSKQYFLKSKPTLAYDANYRYGQNQAYGGKLMNYALGGKMKKGGIYGR